jgi:hypothetical protein
MTKLIMRATFLCIFLFNFSTAQENIKQNIDWTKVREAFGAYCESPSADNASKVLAALPNTFANRHADFEQWAAVVHYVYEGPPFKVLDNLVRKGDKFALRVAFKTVFMSDGAFGEDLSGLIGRAIRVNPTVFLEEAKIFSGYKDRRFAMGSILAGNIDADDYRPEVVKKEIQLRINSLKTVDRADLIEIRDICISELETSLNIIGRGKEECPASITSEEVI